MLRYGGRYLEIGCISRGRTVEFDPSSLVWGSKTIIGVVMYDPWVIPRALEFLGRCRGRYPFDRLVSHTYPLDRIDDAFRDAEWYNREARPEPDHPRRAGAVAPGPPAAPPMTARLVPIGLITLVFNLGGGLVAPALPLYARTLGADYRDLGLIGASHGLAFALLTIPLGRASDRFGRRAILLLSTIGVGASAALYLVAGHVAGLAAGKLLEAAAWAAFWPTLEAWVAERFGARAGAAMGVAYGAYAAAFVVGSSVGGFVIEGFGLRAPFALYLATSALAAILVLALGGRRGDRPGDPPRRGGDAADRHDQPRVGPEPPRPRVRDRVRVRLRARHRPRVPAGVRGGPRPVAARRRPPARGLLDRAGRRLARRRPRLGRAGPPAGPRPRDARDGGRRRHSSWRRSASGPCSSAPWRSGSPPAPRRRPASASSRTT